MSLLPKTPTGGVGYLTALIIIGFVVMFVASGDALQEQMWEVYKQLLPVVVGGGVGGMAGTAFARTVPG